MRDSRAHFRRIRLAAQVTRMRAFLERGFDRGEDRVVRFAFLARAVAEEIKHHRRRPDHRDRIGDAFARDVRRGTVNGFEQ